MHNFEIVLRMYKRNAKHETIQMMLAYDIVQYKSCSFTSGSITNLEITKLSMYCQTPIHLKTIKKMRMT